MIASGVEVATTGVPGSGNSRFFFTIPLYQVRLRVQGT
jgi:hypothetical protein